MAHTAHLNSDEPKPKTHKIEDRIPLIAVGAALFVVFLVTTYCFCWRRKRRSSQVSTVTPSYRHTSAVDISDGVNENGLGNHIVRFSPEQIRKMTRDFSAKNLIGEGGFASVYKGYLPDETVVAVKQLKPSIRHGEQDFKNEVNTIARAHHENLITLVGYCYAEEYRAMVFEFAENNTLSYHLYGETVMPWEDRVKVAIGVANALTYLHHGCNPPIIHRDIKPENILLSNSFEAQVADFGLAKLKDKSCSTIFTGPAGTVGYIAPECASSGRLTNKSDVYSFGVLLLELLTGRKAIDHKNPDQNEGIVEWADQRMKNALDNDDFSELADPRLDGTYNKSEMHKMVQAAIACVESKAKNRPTMEQVLNALDRKRQPDFSARIQRTETSGLTARFDGLHMSALHSLMRSESRMPSFSERTDLYESSSSAEVSRSDSEAHPILH